MNENFLGQNGFIWFVGVVEDRQDPLRIGRVRVRVLGVHTENKEILPTENLPWATIVLPVISSGISGFGWSKPFLVEGSWVMGYFRDGMGKQEPVVLGSLPGYTIAYGNPAIGFSDPRPRENNEKISIYPLYTEESDVSRIAVGNEEKPHPSRAVMQAARVTGITSVNTTWDQPALPGISSYPYNNTYETESGHTFTFDDTPGNEHVTLRSNTGSYITMDSNGNVVSYNSNNSYSITENNSHIYIKGEWNVTANGNLNIHSNNNLNLFAAGDMNLTAGGAVAISGATIDLN